MLIEPSYSLALTLGLSSSFKGWSAPGYQKDFPYSTTKVRTHRSVKEKSNFKPFVNYSLLVKRLSQHLTLEALISAQSGSVERFAQHSAELFKQSVVMKPLDQDRPMAYSFCRHKFPFHLGFTLMELCTAVACASSDLIQPDDIWF